MKFYSPTTLAKSRICKSRLKHFSGTFPENAKQDIYLQIPSHAGLVRHTLIELWLDDVINNGSFTNKNELEKSYNYFFNKDKNTSNLRNRLQHHGLNIVDGKLTPMVSKLLNVKIWKLFAAINKKSPILELKSETVVPDGNLQLHNHGYLKGKSDCILVCEGTVFVIDWKSKLSVGDSLDLYGNQLKFYIEGARSDYAEKNIKGLLVSLTELSDDNFSPKYSLFVGFSDSEFKKVIDSIFKNKKDSAGDWCNYCEVSISGPCSTRSDEQRIIDNSNAIISDQLSLKNGYLEVEIPTGRLAKINGRTILKVDQGIDVEIKFNYKNTGQNGVDKHKILRCRGLFNNRNIPILKVLEYCYY